MGIKKPYFKGQKAHECGHFYPDILRNYDKLSESGNMLIRVCYCLKCRKYYFKKHRLSSFHEPEKMIGEKRYTINEMKELREKELKKKKWGKYSPKA